MCVYIYIYIQRERERERYALVRTTDVADLLNPAALDESETQNPRYAQSPY